MGSLFAAVFERAQGFLLEPAQAVEPSSPGVVADSSASADPAPLGAIEVVVLGMSAGCGVSTVASGLALMLASPDRRQAHLLAAGEKEEQAIVRFGELPAAIVWDVRSHEAERVGTVVQAADSIVLVAPGSGRPAFAELVASLLKERFDRLLVVANRVNDADRWSGRADLCLPEARIGAALVGRGRRPPGALGVALTELAMLVEWGRAG